MTLKIWNSAIKEASETRPLLGNGLLKLVSTVTNKQNNSKGTAECGVFIQSA
jgi:hypothetical protein